MFRLAIALLSILVLSSCVENRPYRLKETNSDVYDRKFPVQDAPTMTVESGGNEFRLSFVEFDEKGDFWDRAQLAIAGSTIKRADKPVLLVIFIHGWHHNAADPKPGGKNPGDVETFSLFLSQLAASESTRNFEVHGVFVGWRGRLLRGPLDYLHFWDRKNAAARMAGQALTETMFEVIRQARRANRRSKCVIIGHSFGALVVEKVMAQTIPSLLLAQDSQRAKGVFYAPADLVLLINSAAESMYAKNMMDFFSSIGHRGSVNADRPLLISITSSSDTATGRWFPFGTFLPNLFARRHYDWGERRGQTSNDVSQHEYLTRTPGHNKLLFTHRIVPIGQLPLRNASPPDSSANNRAFDQNLSDPRGLTFRTSDQTDSDNFEWWRFEPLPNRRRSPYWIMHVPPAIMHGHSPIFTPEGRAMMAALFRITNPKSQPGPRTMSMD